jgi:Domain of unknown function (DUF4365)
MKRPRAHELESESRSRFKNAILAKRWLSRDLDDDGDYGVDEEVEIFRNGETTGLTFRVQVKSMEHTDAIGPYVDVQLEHFEYWESLGLPVLLVMWVADSDTLYAKWVHRYDFGKGAIGEKTHRVRFYEKDRLDQRRTSIETEVSLFRMLGETGLPRPILLSIELPENKDIEIPFAFEVRTAIDQRGLRPYMRLETGGDPRALVARITDTQIRVELPADVGSVNGHMLGGLLARTAWRGVVAEVLLGVGILASRLGASSDAARIVSTVSPDSILSDGPPYADWIVDAFLRVEEIGWLVAKLCNLLDEEDLDHDLFNIYFEAIDILAKRLDTKELKALRKATRRRVRRDASNRNVNARLEHNMATLSRGAGRWDLVESHLERSVALDPDGYGKRPDVAIFRGKARWHAGDFEGARRAYEDGKRLGANAVDYIDPLSDVMFELGEYASAADLIDELIEVDNDSVPDRAVLRRVILAELIEGVGVAVQDRRPLPPNEFEGRERWNSDEIAKALKETDALDQRLWELLEDGATDSGPSFIGKFGLAAYRTNHPGMWLLLLICAKAAGLDDWVVERLKRGAFSAPDIGMVLNDVTGVSDLDDFSEFVEALRLEAFSQPNSSQIARRMNLVDENNSIVHTISLGVDGEILDISPMPVEKDETSVNQM